MIIFKSPQEMSQWSLEVRRQGQTIAFVPTMGALHEGHLNLLREAKKSADKLVLSLFVNPAQFGPREDFERYPRDEDGDLNKARALGVDAFFMPEVSEIYPAGFETFVEVEEISKPLCGQRRPGHFRGVATIVLKLFNIVQPDVALFGEKDFQQLQVIQKMVRDLNLKIQIKPVPTVREKDGLAMSSRNAYLSAEERKEALKLPMALQKAKEMAANSAKDPKEILKIVVATLEESKKITIDYISLCDLETLEELTELKLPALLAIACFVGKTRLIDNCILV